MDKKVCFTNKKVCFVNRKVTVVVNSSKFKSNLHWYPVKLRLIIDCSRNRNKYLSILLRQIL